MHLLKSRRHSATPCNSLKKKPTHESLHNHPLRDSYAGQRSISVTPDWRAVFKEVSLATRTKYIFNALGTHKQLYGDGKEGAA
jgi:mRNA-degrading endonuclease YafQ of YafQ-DinJ toxin-antitoxin module